MKTYNNELYHYGVKGMKWGVRKALDRYYDSDGSRFDRRTKKTIAKARQKGATRASIQAYQKARASERSSYMQNNKAARAVDSSFGLNGTMSKYKRTQDNWSKKAKGSRTAKKAMMKSANVKLKNVNKSKISDKGKDTLLKYGLIGYAIQKKRGKI